MYRVPFQPGSKHNVWRTVFHFNRVPNTMFEKPCSIPTGFQTQCLNYRVPFQLGSKHNVWSTVFHFNRVPNTTFEVPRSSRSVFHVAADDVLIRLDPVAVYSLAVSSRTRNLEPGKLPRNYVLTSLPPVLESGTWNLENYPETMDWSANCQHLNLELGNWKTIQKLWTDQLTVSTLTWNLEPGKLPRNYGLIS